MKNGEGRHGPTRIQSLKQRKGRNPIGEVPRGALPVQTGEVPERARPVIKVCYEEKGGRAATVQPVPKVERKGRATARTHLKSFIWTGELPEGPRPVA